MITENCVKKKKIIATDVDGVLLSWQSGLPYFAQKYNLPLDHILEMIVDDRFITPKDLFGTEDEVFAKQLLDKYNSSDFIRYLAPYADALKSINRMKDRYDFVAITALGDSVDARLNRQFNLNALFPGAFKEIYMCSHNASKKELFERVKEKYGDDLVCYVDDLPNHMNTAAEVFPDSVDMFWMLRGERDGVCGARTVTSWYEIESAMYNKEKKRLRNEINKMIVDMPERRVPSKDLQDVYDRWGRPDHPNIWKSPDYSPVRPQYGIGTGIEYLTRQPTAITGKP